MRKLKMKLCALMLPLVVSACGSMPVALQPCVRPPAPPAWIMQPAPDWQTPLSGIISPSENG
ncbi:Rz1 family lipoprotein [Escherichia albertii]|uniref:Rz1 family lipoprotein n=1 Tax=Escherichia albertii TaxID=208962 RepID=UPI00237BDC6A|nr:Rz1 family lipoprotein [Escherichia albertii]EKD4816093.1 Rz1 family lipoprotein [Escherichia albertii]MDD9760892.1 Rz1 family lipoprotein [Escherichia albertii]